ncbi:hypothetical protein [Terasakiella pusilla]|uniref:hypothetical protein n=1 Tax=Terasakiella pusilla TaxID=64973 RepID=UPI00048E636D|nr:hypothetical protein [Terasakiella pusilla]
MKTILMVAVTLMTMTTAANAFEWSSQSRTNFSKLCTNQGFEKSVCSCTASSMKKYMPEEGIQKWMSDYKNKALLPKGHVPYIFTALTCRNGDDWLQRAGRVE